VTGGRDLAGAALDVYAVGGVVADGPRPSLPVLDARGLIVAAGYVDLQVNGAAGVDISSEPERMWEVAAALPRFGITAFLPTVVTAPPATRARALAALASGPPPGWVGARPLGLHFEGPMIAPARAGAHSDEHIVPPGPGVIEGWSRDAGVAMVTLAPELPGARHVIRELARRGVVVAAGHTDATAACARDAVDAGVRFVTHLFNAMAPIHHRDPGLAGAVLAGLPVAASMIVDGRHLDPDIVRIAWRALGDRRRLLVSDACAGLGAPPGRYRLGGVAITSDGAVARTDGDGLGGTVCGLDECVRNTVAITGCAPGEAVAAATAAPAALLGAGTLGSLRPRAAADLVLLDEDLQVVATVAAGVVAHRRVDR
jgi:N-acetylglucosamine-6-phosphate deacetylase